MSGAAKKAPASDRAPKSAPRSGTRRKAEQEAIEAVKRDAARLLAENAELREKHAKLWEEHAKLTGRYHGREAEVSRAFEHAARDRSLVVNAEAALRKQIDVAGADLVEIIVDEVEQGAWLDAESNMPRRGLRGATAALLSFTDSDDPIFGVIENVLEELVDELGDVVQQDAKVGKKLNRLTRAAHFVKEFTLACRAKGYLVDARQAAKDAASAQVAPSSKEAAA